MVEMNALKRTTSATAKMLASYDVSISSSITTKGGDIVVAKPLKQPGDGSCLFHSLASELHRLWPGLSIDAFKLCDQVVRRASGVLLVNHSVVR